MEATTNRIAENSHKAMDSIAERGAKLAHDTAHKGAEIAHQVIDRGAEFASRTAEKGAAMKKAIMDKSCDALHESETFVKANPKSSVGAAFGIGALIGGAFMFLMMARHD